MTTTAIAGIVPLLIVAAFTQEATQLAPGLHKLSGIEPTQQIAYVRIFLDGTLMTQQAPEAGTLAGKGTTPALIAQCTRDAKGRMRFEVMMHFGGVTDMAYYPPWKSSGPDDLFPPRMQTTPMTMEFLGYTRVKPVTRQWELSQHVPGELRYNPPSKDSHNLEEIAYYMQYLKSLPILRVTRGTAVAQFETTPFLAAIHAEPLCWASGV